MLAKNKRGFIQVANLTGFSLSNFNPNFMRGVIGSVYGSMPVRVKGVRICNNPFAFRVVFAIAYPLLPNKIRQRFKVERCKLDPGLKAPGFKIQPNEEKFTFNLNLISELAPLHRGARV